MKGRDFIRLREAFGLDQARMAELFGVNYTTWYRYEQRGMVDSLQYKLFKYCKYRVDTLPAKELKTWTERVRTSLAIRGTLGGLAAMLEPMREPGAP